MNHLEEEIDKSLQALNISSRKLESGELATLIHSLTTMFFTSESAVLDSTELNEKKVEHNPRFWQEIQDCINEKDLVLLVFDSTYSAWQVDNSQDIASILGETTGYPFWITDSNLTFLIHMDDHDCVIWA